MLHSLLDTSPQPEDANAILKRSFSRWFRSWQLNTFGEPTLHDPKRAVAKAILNLQQAGYQAVIGGGCVRDLFFRNASPAFFHICTNASPSQVLQVFGSGDSFHAEAQKVPGFVRLRYTQGGSAVTTPVTFRVSTFREDSVFAQFHEPQTKVGNPRFLTGPNIAENIWRETGCRDFTINALYYDPIQNKFYDYAGGRSDFERRRIAVNGNADTSVEDRIKQNPIRILRAFRFAAQLDFEIDGELLNAMRSNRHLLLAPPGEMSVVKWGSVFEWELNLMARGVPTNLGATMKLMETTGVKATVDRVIKSAHSN